MVKEKLRELIKPNPSILYLGILSVVLLAIFNICTRYDNPAQELQLLSRKQAGEILTYPEQSKLCYWLSLQPERREDFIKYCENDEGLRIYNKYVKLNNEKSKKIKTDSIKFMEEVASTTLNIVKGNVKKDSFLCDYIYEQSEIIAQKLWKYPSYNKPILFKSSLDPTFKILLTPGRLFHIYFGHIVIKELKMDNQLVEKTQFIEKFDYDISHIIADIGMIIDKFDSRIVNTIEKNPGTKTNVLTLIFSLTDKDKTVKYYKLHLHKVDDLNYEVESYYEDKSKNFLNTINTYKKYPLHKYRQDIIIYSIR